jgi:hypothetical protein
VERYSEAMQEALVQQLRQASPEELERLRDYYGRRGGPGLDLVNQEQQQRDSVEESGAVVRHLIP